ncbi:acetyltransferase [Shewanella sp. 1CM18E]|uniref:acetyltransferase n=1 Tax=Shewanella sp. 1CM18E TaxID=2929169 RepID=UPI0020C16777|nr:acetyltransferase [Shewanella sp. 1CM18E]MCK8043299.1 acetyltransferase [Shewanella sp. 1CM18E]
MKSIAILGASGHGKVLAEIALLCGYTSVYFFDDRYPGLDKLESWRVIGNTEDLVLRCKEFSAVCIGIGENKIRLAKQVLLEQADARIVSLVHPNAVVSQFARIEAGSVIMACAVVGSFSIIGKANIVNTGATVDHDCRLDDGVHISPGAKLAGSVEVGVCSWVGMGASVLQALKLGTNVIVGAGACVIHPVENNSTVIGSPARPIISLR